MSKMRFLKPEFFTDSSVVRCCPLARLLYAGSWVFADDNGILPDDMLQLKMQVLPGDNCDPEVLKCELVDNHLWVPFLSDDKPWLLIRSFCKHQALDRPTLVYPLPDDTTLTDLGYATRDYTHTRNGKTYVGRLIYAVHTPSIRRIYAVQTPSKDERGKVRRGKDGKGKDENREKADAPSSALIMELLTTWNGLGAPFKPVANLAALGTERVDALAARLRDEFFREHWAEAMLRMRTARLCQGGMPSGWVADLGWFLRDGKPVREVLEGKYDEKKPNGGAVPRESEW
jgi:hypothetical protein